MGTEGKRSKDLTDEEVEAIESVDHTVSVTLSGAEFFNAMTLAESRDLSVEEYLRALAKDDFHRVATLIIERPKVAQLGREILAATKKRAPMAKKKAKKKLGMKLRDKGRRALREVLERTVLKGTDKSRSK
jgi:hypothetical protein